MVISEVKRRKPELPYFDENFNGEYPNEAPFTIDELEEIYPAASKLSKSDEIAMEEARKATFELQNGRKGYIALWKHILGVSVADLKKNYANLNSDGATLYSTTDLATIWERIEEYEMEEISRKVGLAALKYGDLSNQVTKDYVFDLDRFSSFEGNTGPYILYTVVRIKSILNKSADEINTHGLKLAEPYSATERKLMVRLLAFNEVIEKAFMDKAPNKICEYIYDVSNMFNKFYHDNRIITEENIEKKCPG